jgi:hypothetical protein
MHNISDTKNTLDRKAGISLITFTLLLVFTLALHPAGGSIQHLIHISGMIIITHSIAILALPFGWIGCWGLTRKIGMDHFGSILALSILTLGLVAALIAAAANGLVLPIFLQHYKDASPETQTAIGPILGYNFSVNHAFDYIYTGAFCLSIFCWSVAILRNRVLAGWIGWTGIALSVFTAAIFIAGTAVNSLHGFRIFAACIALWFLLMGIVLYGRKQ